MPRGLRARRVIGAADAVDPDGVVDVTSPNTETAEHGSQRNATAEYGSQDNVTAEHGSQNSITAA